MSFSIIAQPLDTLFFRGGIPFHAGESSHVTSIFPPNPNTGYGFSRAVLLELFCKKLGVYIKKGCNGCPHMDSCHISAAVGDPSKRDGSLRVKGPYIHITERFFALPCDVTWTKSNDTSQEIRPAILPDDAVPTDLGYVRFPIPRKEFGFPKGTGDYLLSESDLVSYLRDESIAHSKLRVQSGENGLEPILSTERHIGIALERTSRTAKDEHLYSIETIRVHDGVTLWTGIEGLPPDLHLPKDRIVARLGGEGKRVAVELTGSTKLPDPNITHIISESGRFKILLLQHTDFGGSWIPPGFKQSERDGKVVWTGVLNKVEMTLVSAKFSKPIYIGGWDTAKNRPRPLEPHLPAGSVLYMEVGNNVAEEVVSAIHDNHIGLKTEFGFGHSAIGVWSNE